MSTEALPWARRASDVSKGTGLCYSLRGLLDGNNGAKAETSSLKEKVGRCIQAWSRKGTQRREELGGSVLWESKENLCNRNEVAEWF